MTFIRTLASLSAATLVTACASTGGTPADEHANHHPADSTTAPAAAMGPHMKAMQEMHEKMMNAKTPEERQALMADHMKAMQDGMGMMKGMSGMAGMGGMAGSKDMPANSAKRQQMMEQRMDMMQIMMEMMMDRMPAQPAAPAKK